MVEIMLGKPQVNLWVNFKLTQKTMNIMPKYCSRREGFQKKYSLTYLQHFIFEL